MERQHFRIETGTPLEVSAVMDLMREVYAEYGMVFEPREEVPDLLAFERHYVAPYGAFFVVRSGLAVVGSVGVERLEEGRAELHRLYLRADLRGHGLGKALVETAMTWCRTEGITHLLLWSDTRFDRSHALYERMGFQRTGERMTPDINQSREYRFERSL